jgi:hypothetical protein
MASESEILREYLIRLGYEVNNASQQIFDTNITASDRKILKFGASVAGLAGAIVYAENSFANSMRKMYFQSQLADSSASQFKAFDFAGKQIGLFDGQLQAATHSMAQAIRLQPGMKELVEGFGVETQGRDMGEVLIDYVESINKAFPEEFLGAQYAAMVGVDADTYHQMIENINGLREAIKEQKDLTNTYGVDLDAQEETILEYTHTLDRMKEKFEILGQSMLVKFLPEFRDFSKWIEKNVDWWEKWALGINKVEFSFRDLTGFLFGQDNNPATHKFFGKLFEGDYNSDLANLLGLEGDKDEHKDKGADKKEPESKPSGGQQPHKNGLQQNSGKLKQATDYFISQGWSKENAIGIVANLWKESQLNPEAFNKDEEAYGIAQWRGIRAKRFPGDIKKATLEEQLAYVDRELKGNGDSGAAIAGRELPGKSSEESARFFSDYYERPKDTKGEEEDRAGIASSIERILGEGGSNPVTISQTNEFNIAGQDAQSTSNMVLAGQERINQDLIRNMRGAFV